MVGGAVGFKTDGSDGEDAVGDENEEAEHKVNEGR